MEASPVLRDKRNGTLMPLSNNSSAQDESYTAFSLLPITVDVAAVIKDTAVDCGVRVEDVEDVYPCTPIQAGLMISTLKSPAAYICYFSYDILRSTDIERLRSAWEYLKATERILRNRIVWNSSTHSFLQATIAHRCSSSTGHQSKGLMALGHDLCSANFTKAQHWKFELSIHHSIVDGWSMQIILRRLKDIYVSETPLPGLPFTSFVCYLNNEQSRNCMQTREFWKQYLDGSILLDFPGPPEGPTDELTTNGAKCVQLPLDIQRMVRLYGVSPATLLYAASAIVLGGMSESEEVIFGLTLSGRDVFLDSIESMLGPAIAIVPFRTRLDPKTSLEAFLRGIQLQVMTIIPFQHYGLQNIRKINSEAETGCQFRSLVTVQPSNQIIADDKLFENVRNQTYDLIDNLPLSIEFIPGETHLQINCNFQSAYIHESGVEHVLSNLKYVLEALSELSPSSELAQARFTNGREFYRSPSEALAQHHSPLSSTPSSSGSEKIGTTTSRLPETDSELKLEAIFQQTFQITGRVATTANFFELGGDSFTAINLAVAARKRGYKLSMGQIYQNPRLGDLAAIAEALPESVFGDDANNITSSSPPNNLSLLRVEAAHLCCISEDDIEDIYPASAFQEDLTSDSFSEAASLGNDNYVATIVLGLFQGTNFERLSDAVNLLVSQNSILRTRLIHSSHGTMQVVTKGTSWSMAHEHSQRLYFGEGKPLFCYELYPGLTGSPPRLVLTIHHTLYDAWTLTMFLDDLNHQYFSPQVARPGRQPYACFIQYLATLDEAAAAAYWTNQLADTPLFQFPEVPNTHYRPQAKRFSTLKENVNLTNIKAKGISAATVIACAWAVLLSSYCNTEAICFGTVLSGREASIEDIMGPTISTVPMRLTVDHSQNIEDFLTSTQNCLLEMQAFQHYGLGKISRLPTEGPQNACKFTSLLIMQQNLSQSTAEEDGVLFDIIDAQTQMHINYPLVLSVSTTHNSVSMDMQYDDHCISGVQIQRMKCHFCHIVKQLATLDGPLCEIEIITPEDKVEIQAWNPLPKSGSVPLLHRLFEEMVSREPLATAIDCTLVGFDVHKKLTYGQLNDYATEFACQIVAHGSPNKFVGVCLSKSALAIISMIAILKAGRAFVPLDPSAPTARIQTILDNLGQGILLITEPVQINRFANQDLVIVDSASLAITWQSANGFMTCSSFECNTGQKSGRVAKNSTSPSGTLLEDTAYVLHTSGSTGAPKGIIVSHRCSTTALKGLCSAMGISQETRMLQNASFMFDLSVLEIFAALSSGGCVCIFSDAERSAGELCIAVEVMQVNFLFLTPTIAGLLEPEDFPSLQRLALVGEVPTRQILERWTSHRNDISLFNGYGPAEAGFISCWNASITANDICNIGRPVACHLFIADLFNFERLAPIGAVGELVICGDNIADGYLGDKAATSRVFGADPPWCHYDPNRHSRYYRTGDLATYKDDGSVIYIGRKDLQKKIHGQRIELGEIEYHIMKSGNFYGVAVELFGSSTLVAFLDTEKFHGAYTGPLSPDFIEPKVLDELMSTMKLALPSYMVPSHFVPTKHFPTTMSGKTDRRLLLSSVEQVIGIYQYGKANLKRPPETENQEIMKQLWAEAIPTAEIGIDDDFFLLGGTSVSVIRLLMLTRKHHMKFDVSTVYRCRTLWEMAANLEMHDHKANVDTVSTPFSMIGGMDKEPCILTASRKCGISESSVVNIYPCSYMQEAMMMFSEKYPGSYYIHNVYSVPREIKKTRLVQSLKTVWQRHDILRTRIYLDDNFNSTQVVVDEHHDVPIIDQDYNEYLAQTVVTGYGELLSKCVILKAFQDLYLVVSMHHAVFDAWSLEILLKDIKNQYSNSSVEPVETGDYAQFIQHTLQIQNSPHAAQYWRKLLSDLRTFRFPQVKKTAFKANKEYKGIIRLPGKQIASLATIVEAAWGILLGRYSDSEDVCFGVVRSGRTASVRGIDTIMGPTLVSIPRRLYPVKTLRLPDFIKQVEKLTSEALPWEQYGLGNIRKLSETARQACDFHSMVIVQHPSERLPDVSDGLDLEPIKQHGAFSEDCLTLECQPTSDGNVSISLTYDDKAISEAEVGWILYHFTQLISEISIKQARRLEELDMTGPDMITQTHSWNKQPIYTTTRRIEDLFSERMQSWPKRIAIDAVDANLTYQELEDLSSILAFDLQASGLSKGELVPLCLEKSATMIIAIVAVLKAGGAYVPLEIDHPIERLRYIVNDVDAQRVLCTQAQATICHELGHPVTILDIVSLRQRFLEHSQSPISKINRNQFSSSSLAYIIYTSGSTGKPKGVMIDHTALSTTILQRAPILGHKEGMRCILFSSYAFDSSVWEIFAPLLHGSCLFIPDNKQRLTSLPEYLNGKSIEMIATTSTVVQNILQTPSKCPRLTTIDFGGEALTKLIIDEWSGHVRLVNDYGPTEACIVACMNSNVTLDDDPNNIGYADGEGTHLWVVEPTNYSRLAPVGCTGELLISGPTLARGYLNDEEKTSKAFIDCGAFNWVMKGEERCYATGDLVRRNADGSLTFSGRKDMQVQINGIRIEIGEIEYVLGACNGIKLAVVDRVSQSGSGFEILVAFLTVEGISDESSRERLLRPDQNIQALINDASSQLLGRLPKYMVPKVLLPMHRIPASTSGKVDRKALRKLYEDLPIETLAAYKCHSTSKRIPQTQNQKALQELWGRVLGVDVKQVGLDDDFLILGGDSLAAIKLSSIMTEFGLRLGVPEIFRRTKFEDMAAGIRRLPEEVSCSKSEDPAPFSLLEGTDELSTLNNQDDIEDIIPASAIQTSFITKALKWYQPCYIWFFMDIDNQITPACLRLACDKAVQRHRILRTAFHVIGRQCYQVVQKNSNANFKALRSAGSMDHISCHLIDQDVPTCVQLGQIPTRFRLITNDATGDQRLGIGLSHAQYDGFCTDSILSELFNLSTGTLDKGVPHSYSRFIKHSLEVAKKPKTKAFWAQLLDNSQMTMIKFRNSVQEDTKHRSILRTVPSIGKRPGGMSFATVMKTAWSLVLSRLSNSTDIVFGSVVSGRNAPFEGAADVFGPCLNVLPVRLKINPGLTFQDLLQRVHDQQIAMIPYESTPFEQFAQQSPWLPGTRFGSVVLHQNIPRTSVSQDGGADGPRWKYAGAAAYDDVVIDFVDFWLTTLPDPDAGMKCWLTYYEDGISKEAADSVMDYFLAVVATINDSEESMVGTLDELSFDPSLGDSHLNHLAIRQQQEPDLHPSMPISDDTFNCLQNLWKEALPPPSSPSSASDQLEQGTFFSLGGDSLAAAHLSCLCQTAGLDLSLQDIYDFPGLRAQWEMITGRRQRVVRQRPELVFVSEREIGA